MAAQPFPAYFFSSCGLFSARLAFVEDQGRRRRWSESPLEICFLFLQCLLVFDAAKNSEQSVELERSLIHTDLQMALLRLNLKFLATKSAADDLPATGEEKGREKVEERK